jgi:cysteine protease ATG4
MIYESEVIFTSHGGIGSPRKHARKVWGDRPVLILIGHRLGIDGVNPLYYNFIKVRTATDDREMRLILHS